MENSRNENGNPSQDNSPRFDPSRFDRRFKSDRSKRPDISMLWERHHEIIRQVSLGRKNHEIAQSLGISSQTVSNLRNNPIAREKIQIFREKLDDSAIDVSRRIREFTPVAMRLLEEIIEGKHEDASLALRAKYAHEHMSRAGHGPLQKSISVSQQLSRSDIEELKSRALEASQESMDAEFSIEVPRKGE